MLDDSEVMGSIPAVQPNVTRTCTFARCQCSRYRV